MKSALIVVMIFVLNNSVSYADPLKKYFAGWCGNVNAETESPIHQVCYSFSIKPEKTYLVVFTSNSVSEYRFESVQLNEEKTKAVALLVDEANKATSIITMDWFYAVPTYPGESLESYPLTLVGLTPNGLKFSFSELKAFYNGH